MTQIVECVPNISEGRDREVINAVTSVINKVDGAVLLDVDPGEDTNRTVITFVGSPDAVVEAAFRLIKRASELIDMSRHSGAHPRMGATDVCPFVPVAGVTMEDCVELARRLGARVGEELGIPVYLYEYAAAKPERRNLANCRKGEYEGLSERIGKPEWKPDFGPDAFNPKSGATAVGARDFLIAWNVNLNTRSTRLASMVANRLRERGYGKRDKSGRFVRDQEGNVVLIPGKFKGVKAVGWYIDEYHRAQVSCNLTNYKVSPPHLVFDEAVKIADSFGVRVTGSELVGLIPLEAMLQAGYHYLKKQGVCLGVGEEQVIRTAVQSMGLEEISPFNPEEKIIEYRIRKAGRLVRMRVDRFVDELASDSAAPGGGSVAALCGAMAAGLASMVANLTHGKQGFRKLNPEMDEVSLRAQELKAKLVGMVDADTDAFNRVMAAMKLPKNTPEEAQARDAAIAEANRGAALVPFQVAQTIPEIVKLARRVAEVGNPNLTPDAGVAGLTAAAAVRGAAYNVRVNLQSLPDDDFSRELKGETDKLITAVDALAAEVREMVEGRLWERG